MGLFMKLSSLKRVERNGTKNRVGPMSQLLILLFFLVNEWRSLRVFQTWNWTCVDD